jgi:signal transduction histidine kinase
VLTNLLTNAAQAIGGRGRITVKAWREEGTDVVMVADDGPGVPGHIRDQIFEPLFTTKAKGTGLGLAICRQIVERHGGAIDLAPTARGAAFRIRIPAPRAG